MRCFVENDTAPGVYETILVEKYAQLPFNSFFDTIIVSASENKELVFAAIGKHDEIWVRSPFEPGTDSGEMLTAFLIIAKAAGWKGKKLVNVLGEAHVQITIEQRKLITELERKGIMQYVPLESIYAMRIKTLAR